jgi:hypothetical protein
MPFDLAGGLCGRERRVHIFGGLVMLATLARSLALVLLPLSLLVGAPPQALSQWQVAQKASQPQPGTQAGPQRQAQPQLSVPDASRLTILIYTSLIAVNQANLTGNYSVLRDLAAPSFQSANSPAKLAEIFGHLRAQRIDLSPIVLFTPKLVRQPMIDQVGRLTLSGFFDTQPQRVQFDLLFQPVGGQWRLFGIGVKTVASTPAVADASKGGQGGKAAAKAAAAQPASVKKK